MPGQFSRDDFEVPRVLIPAVLSVLLPFFLIVHATDYAKRLRKFGFNSHMRALRSKGFLLKRSIIACNAFATIIYLPIMWVNAKIALSDSTSTCRGLQTATSCVYLAQNFMIYRVLLFRANTYDVMSRFKKRYKVVYWMVHATTPLFLIGITLYIWFMDYRIEYRDIHGETKRVCVSHSKILLHPEFAAVVTGVFDLGISSACLYLLVLPICMEDIINKGKKNIARNVIFSAIAIASTLGFLLYTSIVGLENGYWSPQTLLDAGTLDSFFNITAINLCWPMMFYIKAYIRAMTCTDLNSSKRVIRASGVKASSQQNMSKENFGRWSVQQSLGKGCSTPRNCVVEMDSKAGLSAGDETPVRKFSLVSTGRRGRRRSMDSISPRIGRTIRNARPYPLNLPKSPELTVASNWSRLPPSPVLRTTSSMMETQTEEEKTRCPPSPKIRVLQAVVSRIESNSEEKTNVGPAQSTCKKSIGMDDSLSLGIDSDARLNV
ncbi:hypothetical protein AAMO2058_000840800 [Amorphochlora amoebiformis]